MDTKELEALARTLTDEQWQWLESPALATDYPNAMRLSSEARALADELAPSLVGHSARKNALLAYVRELAAGLTDAEHLVLSEQGGAKVIDTAVAFALGAKRMMHADGEHPSSKMPVVRVTPLGRAVLRVLEGGR